jgi:tetrahydromethanopterin S-methyltransferase subunit B
MQVKAGRRTLEIGDDPRVSLAIQPKSSGGYVVAGIAIGAVCGFVVGSVLTLLVGEKSLLLVQHLWNRLTGGDKDGERVHFELLLQ